MGLQLPGRDIDHYTWRSKRKTPSFLGVSWMTKHGEWYSINCGKLSLP